MLIKALCSLAVIGMLFGGCESEETKEMTTSKQTMATVQETREKYQGKKTTEEAKEEDNVPIGHKQALKQAESYIKHSSFSKKGLFNQLTYEGEGYTEEEAQYAVDNVDADWKEEAVEQAESYLEHSSFSKEGLFNQLTYEGEGYTEEEAQYAVDKVYK